MEIEIESKFAVNNLHSKCSNQQKFRNNQFTVQHQTVNSSQILMNFRVDVNFYLLKLYDLNRKGLFKTNSFVENRAYYLFISLIF
ncbi:MAG: hypothetical protein ACRDCT_26640, partial [Shewanella sp.]